MKRTCKEIRNDFIKFFEERGHTMVPSSSLLPAADPTLLFANAGMNQFKDIVLGREKRAYVRAVNSQKCIRAGGKHNDLEDVGHDTYHHTFFEMLGNWSFGDYFKAEAIKWAWELLTGVWGLPKERLHVTVFGGDKAEDLAPDDEAAGLWKSATDIDPSHIHLGNKKDNFWEMGETGPCGPCSEIHYDFTPDLSGASLVNAGDARVVEIWNLVFMQFNRGADGKLTPLPARHVDTGMGLERISRILQGVDSNYDIDIFRGIFDVTEKFSAAGPYTGKLDDQKDIAYRVIADHARALTFAIADGVIPSNEGRGYVLRRILRRAARYGRQYLNIKGSFLVELVPTVVELMGDTFPEIKQRQKYVQDTIRMEEESFGKTLDRGIDTWWHFAGRALQRQVFDEHTYMPVAPGRLDAGGQTEKKAAELRETLERARYSPEKTLSFIKEGVLLSRLRTFRLGELNPQLVGAMCREAPVISGDDAFELYATYGFPIDLTELMAKERGLRVDLAGYESAMARHRETSAGAGDMFKAETVAGLPATNDSAKYKTGTIGATVIGWVKGDKYVTTGELNKGDEAAVVLDRTNFYGEQGGQVGDAGRLSFPGGWFAVRHAAHAGQCVLHVGVVEEGTLRPGRTVTAEVDASRMDTMRNHTATHLLNWALRKVLGGHINQAGSVVAPDRLRFDFTHNATVTPEQLQEVELLVNQAVLADEIVSATIVPLCEAKKIAGVRAVFGEKYPDPVRVIAVGVADPLGHGVEARAVEFCGGTHLSRTIQVGLFKIVAEESVAKGVRRITAITGREAVNHVQQLDATMRQLSMTLRAAPDELPDRVAAMQKEIKELRKKPAGAAGAEQETIFASPNGKLLVLKIPTADASAMRNLCDVQRQKGAAAILVGGTDGQKVTLVAMVADDVAAQGKLKAGDWVKAAAAIVGGSGGGKPTLAQAGGKDPAKLDEALKAGAEFASGKLP
jgi:alanyl-tRNA synthetase